jgi:hypothetical protein
LISLRQRLKKTPKQIPISLCKGSSLTLGFPWGREVQIQRETTKRGVSHIVALPFTLKKYLKAKKKKKNYGKLK